MGMPTIPDIKPKIDIALEETINLLLAYITFEELSLAHIMNAEAEKLQEFMKTSGCSKMHDLLSVNKSVDKTLKNIIKKEILLEFKFDNVLKLIDKDHKDC